MSAVKDVVITQQNKEHEIEMLKTRILSEYNKYINTDIDWARVCAGKIYSSFDKSEYIKELEYVITEFKIKILHLNEIIDKSLKILNNGQTFCVCKLSARKL